ncbi:MAG: 3-oxoacyl-ACP reductase FabG [Gammaproteobacteria bacterium]|nr:3-oxoacyl-ACP reductase FabG [Gammaproteobacteria bacterium]
MSISDRVALVTGASRGIGQAIARNLASRGAKWVVGTATTEEGAARISDDFKAHNLHGCGMALDLNDRQAITDLVSTIQKAYDHPTILVNNAGITRDNLMLRMKDEEWLDVITTNLNGTFYVTKACLKGMLKARWGRIISLSSVSAMGNAGQANYSASKGGIDAFSRSLAKEIATRNITVNTIAPGFIETDMTAALNEQQKQAILNAIPANRIGAPEEIAAVAGFLASKEASYLTGQVIHVNGGMY